MTIFFSCQKSVEMEETTVAPKTVINPNGDSELALVMREMLAEAKAMKANIENGKRASCDIEVSAMLTSEATEPEKVASQTYKGYVQMHEMVVESFNNSPNDLMEERYNNLLQNCMNCHQALCPGPMRAIKPLFIDLEEK